ncbi:centromere kinetochore component CENP-T-domain-containing protein [Xylariaceae sp. FL0255]|nr:centromere kinetochore component CENP-T-domain-containing protein [Xylariaceae sp. FL0255]
MSDADSNSVPGGRLAPLSTPRVIATPSRNALQASSRRSASARRTNFAATPHARAAIQTIDQRRAAVFTPGRARRQSLREQRQTPRDVLRNLSRMLAPNSQTVSTSSSPETPPHGDSTLDPLNEADEEDDDDDFPIERPRFSLPLGPEDDDDDDDADLKPPRLSGLEDENITMQSIELPRRAAVVDRNSLGSMRFSDYVGPEVQSDDVGIDSGFFPPPPLDETEEGIMEDSAVIERFDADGDERRQTTGGDSIFGPIEIPDVGNETTFIMDPIQSPVRDPTTADVNEDFDDGPAPLYEMDDDDDDVNEPMDVPDFGNDEEDNNLTAATKVDATSVSRTATLSSSRLKRRKAGKKLSRHGIEYPSLPTNVVKRLATTFAKTSGSGKGKITPEALDTLMLATDWFFDQVGNDLAAYANHAGRKTIDESDMITLMRRQRQTNAATTPFSLAQRYLPREFLQELRMPVPVPPKQSRKTARYVDADAEDEEVT